MDYEKKYKEAINRAKAMVKVANSQEEIYNSVITIFPELKESEDKMIREYLIRYIDNTMKSSELKSKLLAWLEKQGTPNKTLIWKHWKDGICGNGEGKPIYLIKCGRIYSLSSCLCFECDYIELSELDKLLSEKQGEQKLPIEKLPEEMKTIGESLGFTTQEECDEYNEMVTNLIMGDDDKGEQKHDDKVKPKFKVGDKVIGIVSDMQYYITDVCYDHYYTESGCIIMFCSQDNFKLVEQKPAWSEEDEKMVANLVDYFKVDDALQYTEKQVVDWLKSLKQRIAP